MWYLSHDLLGVGFRLRGICHPTNFLPHIDLAGYRNGDKGRAVLFEHFRLLRILACNAALRSCSAFKCAAIARCS